ncbi:hypothetical protein D3C85_1837030 [compost metagenome]
MASSLLYSDAEILPSPYSLRRAARMLLISTSVLASLMACCTSVSEASPSSSLARLGLASPAAAPSFLIISAARLC